MGDEWTELNTRRGSYSSICVGVVKQGICGSRRQRDKSPPKNSPALHFRRNANFDTSRKSTYFVIPHGRTSSRTINEERGRVPEAAFFEKPKVSVAAIPPARSRRLREWPSGVWLGPVQVRKDLEQRREAVDAARNTRTHPHRNLG
jgi:hypothetical protein